MAYYDLFMYKQTHFIHLFEEWLHQLAAGLGKKSIAKKYAKNGIHNVYIKIHLIDMNVIPYLLSLEPVSFYFRPICKTNRTRIELNNKKLHSLI